MSFSAKVPRIFFRVLSAGIALYVLVMALRLSDYQVSGPHSWRQADTLSMAYYFCFEDANIFRPRIGHQGTKPLVAIGEFPLYSYLLSLPCQLSGHWFEGVGRWLSLVLCATGAWGWMLWARGRRWILSSAQQWTFLGMFLLTPVLFMHAGLALPDNLAVALWGWGLYFSERRASRFLGLTLQVLGFAVRPYLVPFVFLNRVDWRRFLVLGLGIGVVYLGWYRYWVGAASELRYFNVYQPGLTEAFAATLEAFPKLFREIWGNHFQLLFGLIVLWRLRANRVLGLVSLYVFSVVFVCLVAGSMFVNHKYYLMAAAIVACLAVWNAIKDLDARRLYAIASLWMFVSFANIQHIYHRPDYGSGEGWRTAITTLDDKEAPIAIRADTPLPFYWIKRTGFWRHPTVSDPFTPATCPLGARYFWSEELGKFERCL